MPYTVTKPTFKELEFGSYFGLLWRRGRDISNSLRTPGPEDRWLPVWENRQDAEDFVTELRKNTKDKTWRVRQVTKQQVSRGALGPITIYAHPTMNDCSYGLATLSETMLKARHPEVNPPTSVTFGHDYEHQDFDSVHKPLWDQVAMLLTGLTMEQIEALGGYRIYNLRAKTLMKAPPVLGKEKRRPPR